MTKKQKGPISVQQFLMLFKVFDFILSYSRYIK